MGLQMKVGPWTGRFRRSPQLHHRGHGKVEELQGLSWDNGGWMGKDSVLQDGT